MSPTRLGAAFVLGVAFDHYLDPQSGRRRRAQVRDRLVHEVHVVSNAFDVAMADLAHRSQGAVARAREWWVGEAPSDPVLAERIRTKLGRAAVHARGLDIVCSDGDVELKGDVLAGEVGAVLDAVHGTPGVRSVTDRLVRHTSADTPHLQGVPHRHHGRRSDHWRPARRLAVGCAGAFAVLYGLRTHGPAGALAIILGAAAIARSAGNRRLVDAAGILSGRPMVLHKSLLVRAPPEQVYAAALDLEKFPSFMLHVLDVRRRDADHYECKLRGPAGVPVDWDLTVLERVDGSSVRFLAESAIAHVEGLARFEARPEQSTRLTLALTYRPAFGALRRSVGAAIGFGPSHRIEDDLMRFKSLLEQGRARGRDGVVTYADVMGGDGSAPRPH